MNLAAMSEQDPNLSPYFGGLPRFFDVVFRGMENTTVLERNLESKWTEFPRRLRKGLNKPLFPNQLSQTTIRGTPTK